MAVHSTKYGVIIIINKIPEIFSQYRAPLSIKIKTLKKHPQHKQYLHRFWVCQVALSPSVPRSPSQKQSSLRTEATESPLRTPVTQQHTHSYSHGYSRLLTVTHSYSRGAAVWERTCVLASSSCWKPSTSLLSSAALSCTHTHTLHTHTQRHTHTHTHITHTHHLIGRCSPIIVPV